MQFRGFSKEALQWLSALPENNNREWFQEHKATFETEVKEPMLGLVSSLNARLAEKMPEYFVDQPAKAIFRIYRDTRFSKDKTPYKTHISAVFHRRGMADKASGLYFQVGASGVGIAGGSYMPPNDSLLAIRTKIAADYGQFQKLLKDKKLQSAMGEIQGEALKRPPKGFAEDHPGIEYLKKKQFYCWKELAPDLITSPKLEKEIFSRFLAMHSLVLFLDEAVISAKKKSEKAARFLR